MCVISDTTLVKMLDQFVSPADYEMVNPASIDIRIGAEALREDPLIPRLWKRISTPCIVMPGEFILVETYETLMVPQGYAVEMKLKSSIARQGFNHSLAFWFDPGWSGIGTLEIQNISKHPQELLYQMRFAQLIIHKLDQPATNLYSGKYQNARTVELSKR